MRLMPKIIPADEKNTAWNCDVYARTLRHAILSIDLLKGNR